MPAAMGLQTTMKNSIHIPLVDLDPLPQFRVTVDKEPGQYLGHVTTVLLEDGKTILAVYPKGHGRGAIVMKRSNDGGKTWSDRLPTPANWSTSLEVPTIHRVIDPKTRKKRLILWSGLYPARLAVSDDDRTWSELKPVGEWGGIVVMGSVIRLRNGDYMAFFHDDGRFLHKQEQNTGRFVLLKTVSKDGGLTWSEPEPIWAGADIHLCEPGAMRSPDGKQIALLLRENRRVKNSHVMFSNDEGKTWTQPRELPASITGDRHTAKYDKDGRLVVVFRDMADGSPTKGDPIAWVGRYEDLVNGTEGQYRIRLKDNIDSWDSTYPGVERLRDGTFVVTTYGHWEKDQEPYILCFRFKLKDVDKMLGGK